MKVPATPWTMMYSIYREVIPEVHRLLGQWREKAERIPNPELRRQALISIENKAFHCEGGGVYAMFAPDSRRENVLQFIIAYQTICDYLDGLCDWSESQNPDDFHMLHKALEHALAPGHAVENYYFYRENQDDAGYLKELVETCQSHLVTFPGFWNAKEYMEELSHHYRTLQVHKHVQKEERVPRLTAWFDEVKEDFPDIRWYEFNACTGSTLGIFALGAYAARSHLADVQARSIKSAYFPYVQGVHILLDYFIDQQEDIADDELNFCAQYEDEEEMVERVRYFKKEAEKKVRKLPDSAFHLLIVKGLFAIYLADEKVQTEPSMKQTAKRFIRFGGLPAAFFYINTWVYRRNSKSIYG